MDTHHHKGDVTARTISPERAFLFARLRIGVIRSPSLLTPAPLPEAEHIPSPSSPALEAVVTRTNREDRPAILQLQQLRTLRLQCRLAILGDTLRALRRHIDRCRRVGRHG